MIAQAPQASWWLRVVMSLLSAITLLLAADALTGSTGGQVSGPVAAGATLVSVMILGRVNRERRRADSRAETAARALADANATLVRSNADLAEFASVASHDLQTPVRNIMHAAEFLAEDLLEVADPSAFEYLAIIEDSGARMRGLVASILEYANLSRGDILPRQQVDLVGTLAEVMRERQEELESVEGTIEYGELPSVVIDPLAAFRVFDNIIGNAIKYRSETRAPHIEVSGKVDDGVATIVVTDNGIGFKPSDAEAMFAMFRRLHPSSSYAGSGMGLAIVKRIVEQHGGTITASPNSDVGSSFTLRFDAA